MKVWQEINPHFKSDLETESELYFPTIEHLHGAPEGIPLKGWPGFNAATGGLRPHEFSILCGAPGTGKTALLASWSKSLTLDRIGHLILSIETGARDFLIRKMSNFAGKDLNHGDPIPLEVLKEFDHQHGDHFNNQNVFYDRHEDRMSSKELCTKLAYACEERECKIAFVDNLNFILDTTSSRDPLQEQDRVLHELIILVKRIPMHVFMIMHSRKTENERVNSINDIKGSKTAVDEAQNVFLFNEIQEKILKQGLYSKNHRELMIAKIRRRGGFRKAKLILRCEQGVYTEQEVRV